MKILWHGFAGKNHSWSITAQNICRSLIKFGHEVHIFSTNGMKYFPEDLKNNLIGYVEEGSTNVVGRLPDNQYDSQLSYTALKNFPHYFQRGNKNRFGIWCYEFAGKNSLPNGFAKNYKFVDKLVPPSNFAKQVFLDSGIPESAMKVIPHGIDLEEFNSAAPYTLNTDKKYKILINIAQPHIRKNFMGALDALGKAFTNKDDVCVVLKIVDSPVKSPFEVSAMACINLFKDKYKNHPQIKIIKEFIPNIASLYKSVDICYTMTHAECFHIPSLEGMAAGNIVIAPNWGGQIDFLNENNSLLISGKEIPAPPKALYWEPKINTKYFNPSIDDAVDKLRFAVENIDTLKNKFNTINQEVIKNCTWDKVTKKFLEMVV